MPQKQEIKTYLFEKQKQTRRVSPIMRQRNNSQSNGKEESHKKALNDIEASKLSDTECKTIVLRKLSELTDN